MKPNTRRGGALPRRPPRLPTTKTRETTAKDSPRDGRPPRLACLEKARAFGKGEKRFPEKKVSVGFRASSTSSPTAEKRLPVTAQAVTGSRKMPSAVPRKRLASVSWSNGEERRVERGGRVRGAQQQRSTAGSERVRGASSSAQPRSTAGGVSVHPESRKIVGTSEKRGVPPVPKSRKIVGTSEKRGVPPFEKKRWPPISSGDSTTARGAGGSLASKTARGHRRSPQQHHSSTTDHGPRGGPRPEISPPHTVLSGRTTPRTTTAAVSGTRTRGPPRAPPPSGVSRKIGAGGGPALPTLATLLQPVLLDDAVYVGFLDVVFLLLFFILALWKLRKEVDVARRRDRRSGRRESSLSASMVTNWEKLGMLIPPGICTQLMQKSPVFEKKRLRDDALLEAALARGLLEGGTSTSGGRETKTSPSQAVVSFSTLLCNLSLF